MKRMTIAILGLVLVATLVADDAIKLPVATEEQATAFRAEMAKLAETDEPVVRGKDGWLFLPSELRHVGVGEFWGERAKQVSKATKPEWADPLPVIVDFHKQLEELGVELVLVPVPPKAMVYHDQIISDELAAKVEHASDGIVRFDATHRAFYAELSKQGVEVVDLMPAFLAFRRATTIPFYCQTDTHWAMPAMSMTAMLLEQHMSESQWFQQAGKVQLKDNRRTITINGDLRDMAEDQAIAAEELEIDVIGRKVGDELQPLENNENSPILLLGDSHLLVFHAGGDMHAKGAGLADHLALRTGIVPEVIAVRGSGATPARINLVRKAYRDPDWLKNKKVVIWVFTAREFTETTGWRPLPLTR